MDFIKMGCSCYKNVSTVGAMIVNFIAVYLFLSITHFTDVASDEACPQNTTCSSNTSDQLPVHHHEVRLMNYLLDPNRYDTNVLPTETHDKPLDVKIGIALHQIIDMDDKFQVVTLSLWMRQNWYDHNLKWNSSLYGGIKDLRIMANRIWRPDLTLFEDVAETQSGAEKYFPAVVSADGFVQWNAPYIRKATCLLDVRYYPWDQQRCPLTFASWTYDGQKMNVINRTASGDLGYFKSSGEFEMIGFPVRRHVLRYNCCPNPFPDVTFYIVIQRKPLYYIFNLVLPAIFITVTTCLVFYLPAASGEKISLSVTVLLALTVFLLIVADAMPPQSVTVPLMGSYFAATIVLLALCTSITVIILNIHHRGAFGNRVPNCIRVVILNWLARVMFLKTIVDENISEFRPIKSNQVEAHSDDSNTNYFNERETVRDPKERRQSKKPTSTTFRTPVVPFAEKDPRDYTHVVLSKLLEAAEDFKTERTRINRNLAIEGDWMLVAMVVDRFMLVVFIILTVAVSCGILLNHPSVGANAEEVVDLSDPFRSSQENM